MLCRFRFASLLVCALALPRAAQADPSAADLATARRAFEGAVKLENAQRWTEAEVKLREALAVKDTPGLRFHLAHCLVEQGHLLAAAREYERANQLLSQGAKAPDVQKLLGPAAEVLNRRIPRLAVELPLNLRAPAVSIDGKPYPPSEAALGVPLDPGTHELRVTANEHRPMERTVELREGEQVALRAELAASAPTAIPAAAAARATPALRKLVPTPSRQPSPPSPSHAKLYVMLGETAVAVAGLAVGIGYRAAVSKANDRIALAQRQIDAASPSDSTNACGTPERALVGACFDLRAAIDDHDRAALLSNIGFIGAGVGVAALLGTWLFYPSQRSARAGLDVQPAVGLGQLGLLGRF